VQYLFPKKMSPGRFQKREAFRAEVGKRVEHVALFVVFDVYHMVSLQRIDITRITYHRTTSNASKIYLFI
jgi:hydroxypyruvate isomerase